MPRQASWVSLYRIIPHLFVRVNGGTLECPADSVPADVDKPVSKESLDGARKEAYSRADRESASADRSDSG